MGWTAQIGTELEILDRIVAMLLALADLAERAARASSDVRCRALWALRQADNVAREFAIGSASTGAQQSPAQHATDSADALSLAASLRLLALLVRTMTMRIRRQFGEATGQIGHDRRPHESVDRIIQSLCAAFSSSERPDTS